MPGRNGTGPTGQGSMTGRGLGLCTGVNAGFGVSRFGFGRGNGCGRGYGRGYGQGYGQGYGRNFAAAPTVSKTQKESLLEQKELLENRLGVIDKQLESL